MTAGIIEENYRNDEDMPLHDCLEQREAAFFLLFCLMGIDFFVMISLPDGLRKKYDDHSDED